MRKGIAIMMAIGLLCGCRGGENAYRMYRRLLRYVSPDEYSGEDAKRLI